MHQHFFKFNNRFKSSNIMKTTRMRQTGYQIFYPLCDIFYLYIVDPRQPLYYQIATR